MQLKIREIANDKGITLKELSKRLGITETVLYHYADGMKTPTLERTYKIANELEVTIEDLIMDEDRTLDQVKKNELIMITMDKILRKLVEEMQTEGYFPDMKYESVIQEYKKKV